MPGRTKKKKHFKIDKARKIPFYKISWNHLSPRQKSYRVRSLEVLADARNSKQSLSKISENHAISVETVIRNTNAFRKVNGRWKPKKSDRISRIMKINERGKERSVEIRDSRFASLIGSYHNAVKMFLNTGNIRHLERFRKMRIRDAQGKSHILETNPQELTSINERIEEPEFYEVYVN